MLPNKPRGVPRVNDRRVLNGIFWVGLARSERFELPTLGFEVRCSIQLSYERVQGFDYQTWPGRASSLGPSAPGSKRA